MLTQTELRRTWVTNAVKVDQAAGNSLGDSGRWRAVACVTYLEGGRTAHHCLGKCRSANYSPRVHGPFPVFAFSNGDLDGSGMFNCCLLFLLVKCGCEVCREQNLPLNSPRGAQGSDERSSSSYQPLQSARFDEPGPAEGTDRPSPVRAFVSAWTPSVVLPMS
jgi:hypothetical protein